MRPDFPEAPRRATGDSGGQAGLAGSCRLPISGPARVVFNLGEMGERRPCLLHPGLKRRQVGGAVGGAWLIHEELAAVHDCHDEHLVTAVCLDARSCRP